MPGSQIFDYSWKAVASWKGKSHALHSSDVRQYLGCLEVQAQTQEKTILCGSSLEAYARFFREHRADILCLAEVHAERPDSSPMVQFLSEALALEHHDFSADSPSHIDESKLLGKAVLSRFPIEARAIHPLPNPGLVIERPGGVRWTTHDKSVEVVKLRVGDRELDVANVHALPLHRFKRRMDEPAFEPIRQALADILLPDAETARLITGDFNNYGMTLPQAVPELFADGHLVEAVTADTTITWEPNQQFDHILYTPRRLSCLGGTVVPNLSDHYALIADFQFNE